LIAACKLLFWNRFSVGMAPLVIGTFFFSSILQSISAGILGEYIGSIHTHAQKRPLAVERGRDGIFLESTWLGFGPYNAVPVSLKGFDSPPMPADVVRAALSAFDQITSASETYQQIRRAQIFIDAPTLASKEITDTKGFQFIGGTAKGPVVERVVIFSKDGCILCERGQCSR
jgi:hypothetical protein